MKMFSLALAAGLMFVGPALADGTQSNAMQHDAMSGSNAMSNTSSMSSNAMAPAKATHKSKAKTPAKSGGMPGQDSMSGPNHAMSGPNGNAMSGDNMGGPAKPH